jgi:glutamyl-tRNA synthetase
MQDPIKFKLQSPGEIRVRYAPSPTGKLHLGGARTALFNYLFAKKNNGRFILRIEDTDRERSKKEFEEIIYSSLRYLGIEWDEGPDIGGNFGPYRQSERKEIYAKYLNYLLEKNLAYFCFCSEEELEAHRQYQLSVGQAPKYSGKCANLSKQLVKKYLQEKRPFVIRLRMPSRVVAFNDLIRGEIKFNSELFGDIVLAKNFQYPLYNFACVIDDFEMKISHVLRGEDHLSNTPKQIIIQDILGFPRPQYAHFPLILGPDRTKLSKRHGALSIEDLKEEGYLSEALINFIVLLGWHPKEEKEILSFSSILQEFSLENIQKGPAIFNKTKLDFLNGFYIRQKKEEELATLLIPYLVKAGFLVPIFEERRYPPAYGGQEIVFNYSIAETGELISFEKIKKITKIFQERLKKLSEIVEFSDFFFKKELNFQKELFFWKDITEKEILLSLDFSKKIILNIKEDFFDLKIITQKLIKGAEDFSKKIKREGDRGYLLWPLRVALTAKKNSPPPFEIIEILGKEKTIRRIEEAKKFLKK